MKVHFKRLAAAAVAVAMSLSLSVSAFAAVGDPVENGTLTVTGDQLADKYVYAIQMFEARAQEGNDAYTFDSYELIDMWEDFFKDATYFTDEDWKAAGVIEEGETSSATITDYSDAALAYVEWLADENQKEVLMTFANDAKKWAESKDVFKRTYGEGDQASVLQEVTVDPAWSSYAHAQKATKVSTDETKGTTTFTNLNTGYYLVYPEGGSTGVAGVTQGVYTEDARGTDAMLINIPTNETSATWNIKSTYPTVDKTVDTDNEGNGEADDNGSAQLGDTVTFTLTSAVPDMSDYGEFYFAFNDTMSKGLEFVEKTPNNTIDDKDVTVKIGGAEVTTGYTVTLTGNKLKVEFANLKTVYGATTGATITVTYQAKITEDAVSTGDNTLGTAENEANVEYSNDPDSDGHGTSTPDKSKVYTYDIKIEKYWVNAMSGDKNVGVDVDDSWDGNHNMGLESLSLDSEAGEKLLAGATFVLSTLAKTPSAPYGSNGEVELVSMDDGNYRVATDKDTTSTIYEFTTIDTAPIIIKGLEAGTYYLHEIDAPDGFNKLKEPVKIQIVVEPIVGNDATNSATLDNPVYIIDGEVNTAEDNAVKVENKQGIELPETGSIGTIGLTVAGVVIVAIGLFAMPRKKKDQD